MVNVMCTEYFLYNHLTGNWENRTHYCHIFLSQISPNPIQIAANTFWFIRYLCTSYALNNAIKHVFQYRNNKRIEISVYNCSICLIHNKNAVPCQVFNEMTSSEHTHSCHILLPYGDIIYATNVCSTYSLTDHHNGPGVTLGPLWWYMTCNIHHDRRWWVG